MNSAEFKPKVSSSLPRGFRSVKLNFGGFNTPVLESSATQVVPNTIDGVDFNNNQIVEAGAQDVSSVQSPTSNHRSSRPLHSNRYGLYTKQASTLLTAPDVSRHSAPATSPPPPPVPPPPVIISQERRDSGHNGPIYLQPYEVPPETASNNVKPFWSLPEIEQRAVLQQLSRSPSPIARPQSIEPEQIEHVITDCDPPPNAQFLYETDSHRFYSVPTGARTTKLTQISTSNQIGRPQDGIGPVNESGVPVALRTGVKEEYASDWYKTMFKTLHKADKPKWLNDQPVTIKIPKRKSSKKDFKLDSYNDDGRRSKNENLTNKYTESNQYRRYQEEERRKKDIYKDSSFLCEEPSTKYVIKKKKSQKSKSPVPKKAYASVQRGEEIPLSGLSKAVPIYRPRGFYEQKQQEQVFFTPNQSPVPPPPPTSSSTYPASYEPTGQAPPAVPARPVSPSQYTQTIVSTASPGFSIHSIDEWQRRQDEDLNQIYCTIRRNHEVNRLKESGRLVSPQPQEQRSRSSHQLYQKEVQSSAQSTARPVCHLQPETLSIIGRPMYMHNSERPQPIDLQPSTVSASHQLLTASACTTNRSTVETFAPIPPTRPLIPPSRELTTVAVCSLSPSKCVTAPVSAASQAGFALHANPTKKRTLIEQTYYDRERFDDCQVPKPISLDRKWTEARLDGDWSSLQEPSTQSYQHRLPPVDGKALSDLECSGFRSRKALPVSQRQPAIGYNTIGRTGIGSSSQCNGFDSLGLRSSASLGNLPSATCSSPIVAGGSLSALSGSKGHSISLAEDVNNVSFAHHPQDDDDDLDKLIKKIEQDAIIQDELDNYNTTQIYQTPVLNKFDPNFRDDVNHNRFLLHKHYEHDSSKNRTDETDLQRRHHYSPNPESVVHLNRYEQAYREKEGAEIRHKVFAKVLRDFRASRDNEISVQKGDIVIISRQIDHNWVEIEDTQSGLKGFVPRKYLDSEQEGMGTAKFDFQGRAINNEISLRKGEAIKVIRQVDENWFRGVNSKGEVGIFPCSYVDMLKKPLTEELHINLVPGLESPAPAHSPSHLSPQTCNVTRTMPANTIRQAIASTDSSGSARSTRPVKMFRVLFNYTPQQSDELQLIAGDLVEVSLECDDGWFVGRSSLTGKTGMFPGNYVERLL